MPDEASSTGTGGNGSGGEPTILSRKDLRKQSRGGRKRAWWYVLGAVVVLLIGGGVAYGLTKKTATSAHQAAVTTLPAPPGAPCPLTGAPPPTGTVPARSALAVKIGNYTADRPSAGLNQADLVFEEPVEGAITRLVAVFQCQAPTIAGDVRSAREPDVGILSQLSRPLFAHVGGIQPVLNLVDGAPLTDIDLRSADVSAIVHPTGRYAPYSTFVNTNTLWYFNSGANTPPAPIFTYSSSVPPGTLPDSGGSVHIPFSSSSDVTWTWSQPGHAYLRSYAGTPDRLLDGSITAAQNVVVMSVQTFTGPWLENDLGGYEVEVDATGSGHLVVLRNGVAVNGTWSRSSLTQPATLTTTGGAPISLQPGTTWIELVPDSVQVTTAPLPPATTPAP